jgi:hypothetical protein
MPFGIMDTTYVDLPAGIDEAYLRSLENRSGTSFAEVLGRIDGRLTAFNDALDPLMAELMYVTDDIQTEEFQPVAFDVNEAGEYTVARPQYTGGQKAYMLPIRKYDVSTMWTEDGLLTMSDRSIDTNLDSILLGLRTRARKEFLRRLFSDAEVAIDYNSAATNPGFAGSGTGNNAFTRPYPDGTSSSGISHYIRDTTANRLAAIRSARTKLRKWYPEVVIELLPSETFLANFLADAAVIAGVGTTWVTPGSTLIRPADTVAEALVDPDRYVGVMDGNIRVRKAITDFTGDYALAFVTFGNLNDQNALAWRFDPMFGREAYLRSRSMFPLDQSIVLWKFGVGVSNRVAAVPIFIAASGAYVPPTIS